MPLSQAQQDVRDAIKDSPEYYRPEFHEAIMQKSVLIGMWPTEALLAGGGGVYRIRADEKIWPKNSDLMKVMRAQSIRPDDSHIEITFRNTDQFNESKPRAFTAYFKRGVCTEINGEK